MNSAIVIKTARDSWVALLLTSLGIIGFGVLFVAAMQGFGQEVLIFLSKFKFLADIFEAAFGIQVDGAVSLNVLLAVGFTHAVVLMLSWGFLVATVTRVIAGEIERGTADLLLTLPLSRARVFFSSWLVVVLSAALLAVCPLLGIALGAALIETKEPVQLAKFIPAVANFFAINLTIAGITTLVASLTNRRGVAVAVVIAIAIVSVMHTFLEPFLTFAKKTSFLSLLNYYRPVDCVRTGDWPIENMTVLTALAVVGWVIGLVVYCRKDIPVG